MHTENTERLGLVEEGQRKRARYGRYIYRAPALPPAKPAPVDLATAEIRNRIDKNPNYRETWNELARETPTKVRKETKHHGEHRGGII